MMILVATVSTIWGCSSITDTEPPWRPLAALKEIGSGHDLESLECLEGCNSSAEDYDVCVAGCLEQSWANHLALWGLDDDPNHNVAAEADLIELVNAWLDYLGDIEVASIRGNSRNATHLLSNSFHAYITERHDVASESSRAFWSEFFAVALAECIVELVQEEGDVQLRKLVLDDIVAIADTTLQRTSALARIGLLSAGAQLVSTDEEARRFRVVTTAIPTLEREVLEYSQALELMDDG